MVWYLILAHLLGDFVLQTDWMVRRRDDLRVLTLHAGIHFALMFVLVGSWRSVIWPYLLIVALVHLCQDRIKNNITNHRPDWTKSFFIIDQALHFAALFILVWWLQQVAGLLPIPEKPELAIVAVAFLLISYVWFIVERIFNLSNADYLHNLNKTKFPRMLTRIGLVSLFLLIRVWLTTGLAVVLSNPYPHKKFRQRALVTDISVSLIAIFFLSWALG